MQVLRLRGGTGRCQWLDIGYGLVDGLTSVHQVRPQVPERVQLAIMAVLTGLVAVYAWHAITVTHHSAPNSTAALSGSTRPGQLAARPIDKVVVFGDSYAAGYGASRKARAWVARLGRTAGWTVHSLAHGGTGYLTVPKHGGAPGCQRHRCLPLPQVVSAAAATEDPDLVLVSSGRSDVHQPADVERAAVQATFRAARRCFPRAQIVAVNPLWDGTTPPAALWVIRSDVKAAVTSVDGTMLDVGQPLSGQEFWVGLDGVTPNNAGHTAIYRAVLAEARKAGLISE